MTDIQKTARLINLLRINGIQGGLLAAEVLSFIASGPRTYKDLEKWTNYDPKRKGWRSYRTKTSLIS